MTDPNYDKILFYDKHYDRVELLRRFKEAGMFAPYYGLVMLVVPEESQVMLYARMMEIPEVRALNISLPVEGRENTKSFFSIPGIADKLTEIMRAAAEEISTHPKYTDIFRQGRQLLRKWSIADQEITVQPRGYLVTRIEKRQIKALADESVVSRLIIGESEPDPNAFPRVRPTLPARGRELERV